ncbi:hypothetical protein ACU808_10190 [Pandoraea sputorum]
MTDFDESIPSSRRIFRRRLSLMRIAEVGFGWLAKSMMVALAVTLVALSLISDGTGDLPSTRRQWLAVAAIIFLVLSCVVAYHYALAGPSVEQ